MRERIKKDDRTTPVSFSIRMSRLTFLDSICDETGKTRSEVLNRLLDFLEDYYNNNSNYQISIDFGGIFQ